MIGFHVTMVLPDAGKVTLEHPDFEAALKSINASFKLGARLDSLRVVIDGIEAPEIAEALIATHQDRVMKAAGFRGVPIRTDEAVKRELDVT